MLLAVLTVPPAAAAPQIIEVYPDPPAPNDRGEWIIIDTAGVGGLRIADGEAGTSLPAEGRVILSNSPAHVDPPLEGTRLRTDIRLANRGETLRLLAGNETVDIFRYQRAREGVRYHHRHGPVPVGVTPRAATRHTVDGLTPLIYPEAAGVLETIVTDATDRIVIGCYTFASPSLTDRLLDRLAAGVSVQLLCERAPIGGVSHQQMAMLDRLAEAGAAVRLIGGPGDRYRYHHPKYLVADGRAVVLTENFKPAGTGGRDSRGWGLLIDDPTVAAALVAIHTHDVTGADVEPFAAVQRALTVTDAPVADGSYPRRSPPAPVDGVDLTLATAPTAADPMMLAALAEANRSIRVIVPRLPSDGRHFRALVDRARAGVSVRVLLSNAWYDADRNAATVAVAERLNESGVPITVRIATPAGRFGKVHAKGAIIDDRQVLLGSLNWNDGAPTRNRELVVRVDDPRVAASFMTVYDADWRASGTIGGPLTGVQQLQLGGAAALVATAALWRLQRTVRFV
jgi:Phosphatidylserine/phosphatidylglycerophosphate/cardiolipin synthases and related enzymes